MRGSQGSRSSSFVLADKKNTLTRANTILFIVLVLSGPVFLTLSSKSTSRILEHVRDTNYFRAGLKADTIQSDESLKTLLYTWHQEMLQHPVNYCSEEMLKYHKAYDEAKGLEQKAGELFVLEILNEKAGNGLYREKSSNIGADLMLAFFDTKVELLDEELHLFREKEEVITLDAVKSYTLTHFWQVLGSKSYKTEKVVDKFRILWNDVRTRIKSKQFDALNIKLLDMKKLGTRLKNDIRELRESNRNIPADIIRSVTPRIKDIHNQLLAIDSGFSALSGSHTASMVVNHVNPVITELESLTGPDGLNNSAVPAFYTWYTNYRLLKEHQYYERFNRAQDICIIYLKETQRTGLLIFGVCLVVLLFALITSSWQKSWFPHTLPMPLQRTLELSCVVIFLLFLPLLQPVKAQNIDPSDPYCMLTYRNWYMPGLVQNIETPGYEINEDEKTQEMQRVNTEGCYCCEPADTGRVDSPADLSGLNASTGSTARSAQGIATNIDRMVQTEKEADSLEKVKQEKIRELQRKMMEIEINKDSVK